MTSLLYLRFNREREISIRLSLEIKSCNLRPTTTKVFLSVQMLSSIKFSVRPGILGHITFTEEIPTRINLQHRPILQQASKFLQTISATYNNLCKIHSHDGTIISLTEIQSYENCASIRLILFDYLSTFKNFIAL